MSGKVVNLNRARKARTRAEGKRKADANAARHGQTKAERDAETARAQREAERLDQHRRDPE